MKNKKSLTQLPNKGIISLLAILAIVLATFVYLMSAGYLKSDTMVESEIKKVESVSDSDEVNDIESDINDTELDNMDTEMTQIEAELNAAINESK